MLGRDASEALHKVKEDAKNIGEKLGKAGSQLGQRVMEQGKQAVEATKAFFTESAKPTETASAPNIVKKYKKAEEKAKDTAKEFTKEVKEGIKEGKETVKKVDKAKSEQLMKEDQEKNAM